MNRSYDPTPWLRKEVLAGFQANAEQREDLEKFFTVADVTSAVNVYSSVEGEGAGVGEIFSLYQDISTSFPQTRTRFSAQQQIAASRTFDYILQESQATGSSLMGQGNDSTPIENLARHYTKLVIDAMNRSRSLVYHSAVLSDVTIETASHSSTGPNITTLSPEDDGVKVLIAVGDGDGRKITRQEMEAAMSAHSGRNSYIAMGAPYAYASKSRVCLTTEDYFDVTRSDNQDSANFGQAEFISVTSGENMTMPGAMVGMSEILTFKGYNILGYPQFSEGSLGLSVLHVDATIVDEGGGNYTIVHKAKVLTPDAILRHTSRPRFSYSVGEGVQNGKHVVSIREGMGAHRIKGSKVVAIEITREATVSNINSLMELNQKGGAFRLSFMSRAEYDADLYRRLTTGKAKFCCGYSDTAKKVFDNLKERVSTSENDKFRVEKKAKSETSDKKCIN